jgi:hypothetical protein
MRSTTLLAFTIVGLAAIAPGCQGKPAGTGAGPHGTAGGAQAQATRWLRVDEGVTPVAVIEVPAGAPATLAWSATGPAADQVKALWPELGQPDGFHEKMHLRGEGGERGPLASVHFPPDHPEYFDVVRSKAGGTGLNVEEIVALGAPVVSGRVRSLSVSHDGDRVGRIDFGGPSPKLELAGGGESSPKTILSTYMDQLSRMESLRVWYTTGGVAPTLVSREARPGDPAFGDVVRVWLISSQTMRGPYFDVEATTE